MKPQLGIMATVVTVGVGREKDSDLCGSGRDGPLSQCTHCRFIMNDPQKVSYFERSLYVCSR